MPDDSLKADDEGSDIMGDSCVDSTDVEASLGLSGEVVSTMAGEADEVGISDFEETAEVDEEA